MSGKPVPVLEIEHLTMQFGGVVAVDHFSMVINQGEIELDQEDELVELGSIDFYSEQEAFIELIAQLNFETSGSSQYTVEYYWELDGVLEYGAKSGQTSSAQLFNIDTLSHLKPILTPGLHTMKLKAKLVSPLSNADLTFYAGDVRIILKGQGLAQEHGWDGIISLSSDWLRISPDVSLKWISETIIFSSPPVSGEEFNVSVQVLSPGANITEVRGVCSLTIEPD